VVADERQAEIISVAERLFLEKGYHKTSIAEIIEEAGIAKGTFYHHFKSKDELAEAMVTSRFETLRPLYDEIAARSDLDPVSRMQAYFDISSTWKSTQIEFLVTTVMALYREENALILRRMFANTIALLGPYLNDVIRDGIDAGVFHTPYRERFGEFLLSLFVGIGASQSRLIAESLEEPTKLYDYAEMIAMLEHSINRLLGLENPTISVGAQPLLDQIHRHIKEKERSR